MRSFSAASRGSLLLGAAVALVAPVAFAGYQAPVYIDGCRSADGRFEVVAEIKERGATQHGPHTWEFIWKNTQTGETRRLPAQGIQGGLIYAQLFIAPDGETFALWNHMIQYWPQKSEMHSHETLPYSEKKGEEEKFRGLDIHKKRLIIYRKDGSILKEFGVGDFLTPEEWPAVTANFTVVSWLSLYDGMDFKQALRKQYSCCRVSPDYTVLEFQPVVPRSLGRKPRVVRVSLTDGRIFGPDEEITDPAKVPVRPFVGDSKYPSFAPEWSESYTPSLDPVREAGQFRIVSIGEAYPVAKARPVSPVKFGAVQMLASGYQQADTPSFVKGFADRKEPSVLFADVKRNQLLRHVLGTENTPAETVTSEAARGRIGPDSRAFYGLHGGKLVSWDLTASKDAKPVVLCEKAANDREFSINDLAISSRGMIYFTTLKDPEKGRLSVFDPRTGKVTVLFDGEQEEKLHNPNGIALDRAERFLFVGISSYKNPGRAGIYCFPIRPDGTIDLETGKQAPWVPVKADGIAASRNGDVFMTVGGKVACYDVYGRSRGDVAVKGIGTNLCLTPENVIYVTTQDALYAVKAE